MTTSDRSTAPGAGPSTAGGRPLDVLRQDIEARFRRAQRAPPSSPPDRDAALRALAPLPVPRVVITLYATTAAGVIAQATAIPQQVHGPLTRFPVQLELRLDPLKDSTERAEAAAFVLRLGVPFILTLRAAREGGQATLTDTERQWLLAKLIAVMPERLPPGSLIDLEAASVATDPIGWKGVIEAAQRKGLHILLSHHDQEGTPRDPDAILPPPSLLDDVPGGAAVVYKSATTMRDWQEELAVLAAMCSANRSARRYAIMGMGRPMTRLLAPFYGVPLVYAASDATHGAAPGQVPFGDLLATWWRWGVRPRDAGLIHDDEQEAPETPARAPRPRLALLGRPALHSLSPAMQNAAFTHLELSTRYFPLEPPTEPADPHALLAQTRPWFDRLGIVGGNATTPYKEALAAIADEQDAAASALGAANTFRVTNGLLHVTNTDPDGVRAPLQEREIRIVGTRVLILGAGAAARAAAYALRDAERVTITNRSPQRAATTHATLQEAGIETHITPWEERERAATEADLILQCTSVGLAGFAQADASPLPPAAFRSTHTVYELIYEPLDTPFLQAARAAGATTIDGLEMLLAQGAAGFSYWTGNDAPRDVMRHAVHEALDTPLPASLRPGPRVNGTRKEGGA